jgi:hypothetical protein
LPLEADVYPASDKRLPMALSALRLNSAFLLEPLCRRRYKLGSRGWTVDFCEFDGSGHGFSVQRWIKDRWLSLGFLRFALVKKPA